MEQNEECIFSKGSFSLEKFPLENALEIILMFDAAGRITYANSAAKNKLEYESDLCGRHISDVFPNTFKPDKDILESGFAFGYEPYNIVAYRKNLTCFPVEARIMQEGNNSGMYICMANDTLEKEFLNKEVEKVRQEAEQALKVKSEFVANITHELRTPVNGVLGNIRELLSDETDERKKKQFLLIQRCCDDMNKIINNILDFSKLEAGKFTLELREFNFRNMLDYVKSNHINKITEKGLGFFMTVSPQIPEHVIGDELRIVQVLNNLLSNAQKFTSLGKITVEVLKTAQINDKIELFFIVTDTGIGIDKADEEKLFQSFSQVDASISRKYGGTGLGLNICKQLVELMGGRIEVESRKNRGSTFSFSVWVGSCGEVDNTSLQNDSKVSAFSVANLGYNSEEGADDEAELKIYGTPENKENLKRTLSKLVLCVEMENWEKAEMFMETIRQLTEDAPHDVKRMVLRLKMAVQKENYDKAVAGFEELDNYL